MRSLSCSIDFFLSDSREDLWYVETHEGVIWSVKRRHFIKLTIGKGPYGELSSAFKADE